MPWICLDDDELAIVKRGLDREIGFHLVSSHKEETIAAQNVRDRIKDAGTPGDDDDYYAEAAAYKLSDPDEVEGFPDHPYVSQSEEGAYVMAWIWVDAPDADDEEDDDEDE